MLTILCAAASAGERDVPDRNAPPDAEQQRIKEELQRKVSFEFVDTPLQEMVQFFNGLIKPNMVLDPKMPNKDAKITLKAADMSLELALSWITRLADLEWQIRDQAIYIFDPKLERRREAEARQGENRQQGQGQTENMPKLSVRRPDGTAIEADVPLLMRPGLGQQILDHTLDNGCRWSARLPAGPRYSAGAGRHR